MPEPAERPLIATQPISLVLAAHNAAADVEVVVAEWHTVLDGLVRPYEIILVNDGSTDDTTMLADLLASRFSRLRVIHHAFRQGFGAALRSGIAAAQHPLLAYTTCDKQYLPAELKRLLDSIDKVDLVTGYRQWLRVPQLLRGLGLVYRIFVRVIFGIPLEPLPCWLGDKGQVKRWFARWIFGVRVHDVECAFRLFRRAVFERIPIQSNGPFAQVEILAKANFLGCWMAEVPVSYQALAGRPLWGSLIGGETYWSEARRLFGEPSFKQPVVAAEMTEVPPAAPETAAPQSPGPVQS
jgi:glycosyltransferase involved in cell wall biosynthesis